MWRVKWAERMVRQRVVHCGTGGRTIQLSLSELCGHLSFAFMSVSYLVSDILWLRASAIAAGSAMIAFNYWHPHGRPLWLPLRWNLLFIGINSVQIAYILTERNAANKLSEDEKVLYSTTFQPVGLSKLEYKRFLRKAKGEWITFKPGQHLTFEGAPSNHVMVVLSGEADVSVRKEKVYELGPGQFIGENGLHVGLRFTHGLKTTATVTAKSETKCLSWRRGSLIDALEEDESTGRAVQQAIAADLLRKLNRMSDTAEQQASNKSHAEKLHVKQEFMYSNLLKQALSSGKITEYQKINLLRFRQLHNVHEPEHLDALAQAGWTLEEFERGFKISDESDPEYEQSAGSVQIENNEAKIFHFEDFNNFGEK
jgi:CRP-like cAMP-binding protein